ncbi:aspartate 1-decarboxylase [Pseudomonadota bacterium]
MQLTMLKGKIHRATVTEADLNYVGSITIDKDLLEASGLLPNERVDVLNITNGERLSTYVLEAARGSKQIKMNGAAARKISVGDLVIIIAYAHMSEDEAKTFKPKVVIVDEDNSIKTIN